MKQALIALALIAFAGTVARADYTLVVSPADLDVLSAALNEMPRKTSEPLVQKFLKQLAPQYQAEAEAAAKKAAPAPEAPKAEDKK